MTFFFGTRDQISGKGILLARVWVVRVCGTFWEELERGNWGWVWERLEGRCLFGMGGFLKRVSGAGFYTCMGKVGRGGDWLCFDGNIGVFN